MTSTDDSSPRLRRVVARIPFLGPLLQRLHSRSLKQQPVVVETESPAPIPTPDIDFLRSLGYRFEPAVHPRGVIHSTPPPPSWPAGDVYFVTVCTENHAPYTRTLIESLRRQHPTIPIIVAVIDALSRDDTVEIDGALILTGRDIFGADLDYTALKFNASELCCVAKPYIVDYVLRHSPATRAVYVDSDIYVFAPLDAMLAKLDEAEFVVTPHLLAPMPAPEHFWERPTLGEVFRAGVFNAGIFAARRGAESAHFLAQWKALCSGPGAWVESQGTQTDQHSLGWLPCLIESYAILRDPTYNVAYWNLHERSLRYAGEENGQPQWTIDGRPLGSFHYSAFSLQQPNRISKWDTRHHLYLVPALARLCDFYVERLHANDRGELGTRYRFDSFPSGIPIDRYMRTIFREDEVFLRAELDPWTPEGEAHYAGALLRPIPYRQSLAPILLKLIYDVRLDLHAYGDISFDPHAVLQWMLGAGAYEEHYDELFARHRPAVPTLDGAILLASLRQQWPEVFEGLTSPLFENRREFLARLEKVAPEQAQLVRFGTNEQPIVTAIGSIRRFVSMRPDLLVAFPDLLFDDGPAFVAWLREKRFREHYLPEEAIAAFAARIHGEALARVFTFLARTWPLMERFPLAIAGQGATDFARNLLSVLRNTIEFDVADVEMFLWTMDVKPWAGVPLTLELPIHTTRHPSSWSRNGQEEILEPLLESDPRFADALSQYREQFPSGDDHAPPSQRSAQEISVFAHLNEPRIAAPVPHDLPSGVNVFGYHRSDIGLGQMTRGLVLALDRIGCATSNIVLGNTRMDDDLTPADLIRKFDPEKGTNVFVSYPHLQDSLLRTMPDEVIQRHRNIAYLAWEQREGTHYWKNIYSEYHQVWALSDFTARSLTGILGRTVHSVPCVVDVAAFPPPALKEGPTVFTFLYVFDASSSTERKNPEAVVRAFQAAFRADDRVRLIIKASSADRMGNRARLRRLLAAIGTDPRIEVRVADLDRRALYGLISVCDCYVSLHRAEGFGYTCAEAMAYGKPVIATGYSGNMQFMNDTNSYPVRYREVEVAVMEGPFQRGSLWAEADVSHAAELMRHVYEDRAEAAARGERGRATIASMLSPEAIGARVAELLDGRATVAEAV